MGRIFSWLCLAGYYWSDDEHHQPIVFLCIFDGTPDRDEYFPDIAPVELGSIVDHRSSHYRFDFIPLCAKRRNDWPGLAVWKLVGHLDFYSGSNSLLQSQMDE